MIATSHPAASLAGLEVLAAGGTATDAAIAAAAVLCIAEPHMTGIGGDCFWIHAAAGGQITAYNGSGRTPAAATNAYYAERGIKALAPTDAHTVTIPGAADAWERLHQSHGSVPMDRLLAPAIKLAEQGCLIHPRVAFDWQRFESRIALRAAASAAFLPLGRVLAAGDRHANPALARTLRPLPEMARRQSIEDRSRNGWWIRCARQAGFTRSTTLPATPGKPWSQSAQPIAGCRCLNARPMGKASRR